ncbi:MAG: hypothetical protein ACRDV9_10310, partial [Acidimicrobiia bacterium]
MEDAKAAVVERAAAHARAKLSPPEAVTGEEFLRRYWQRVVAEDVAGRDPIDVYGAALAHLHLAAQRQPGNPRLRVYTPSFDDHGWASSHSVVELVTDDMPFLVDSVTMELLRCGVGIHLVVHPVVDVARDPAGQLLGLGD